MSDMTFIPPANPTLNRYLPTGDEWSYEVKFDGYRAQLHIAGKAIIIYSRNGHDVTQRYPAIVEAARQLPLRSAILDGELVIDGDGQRPDFRALHSRA